MGNVECPFGIVADGGGKDMIVDLAPIDIQFVVSKRTDICGGPLEF